MALKPPKTKYVKLTEISPFPESYATLKLPILAYVAELLGPMPTDDSEKAKLWSEIHSLRQYYLEGKAEYEQKASDFKETAKKSFNKILESPPKYQTDILSVSKFGKIDLNGMPLSYEECKELTGLKEITGVEYDHVTMKWRFAGKDSYTGTSEMVAITKKDITDFLADKLKSHGFGAPPKDKFMVQQVPADGYVTMAGIKFTHDDLVALTHLHSVATVQYKPLTKTYWIRGLDKTLFPKDMEVTVEYLEDFHETMKGGGSKYTKFINQKGETFLKPFKKKPLHEPEKISPGGMKVTEKVVTEPAQYVTLMMDWSSLNGASTAEVHKTLITLVSKIGNNKAALIHALAAEETSASCIVTVTGLETVKDQITALENLGVTFKV